MRVQRAHRAALLTAGVWAALAYGPASASAAPVTLGQVAPATPPAQCKTNPAELLEVSTTGLNPSTNATNSYVAPEAGVITSWSTNAAVGAGQQMTMKIYRPIPNVANTYTVIAHNGPHGLKAGAFNSFATSIPVQAGDFIGLDDGNASGTAPNACFFDTTSANDILGVVEAETPDGVSVAVPPLGIGGRPNVAATLQPRPTIAAIGPAAGPVRGGTSVTVTGTDFENATAVNFGAAPASSFTIASEGEIVASAPFATGPGSVDVSVSTAAGITSAAAADRFTYEAESVGKGRRRNHAGSSASCVVPRLKGKKLKAVRRRLKKAHCKLGKVKAHRGRAAKVKKQNPKGGRVLASGAKVNVTFGARPH